MMMFIDQIDDFCDYIQNDYDHKMYRSLFKTVTVST